LAALNEKITQIVAVDIIPNAIASGTALRAIANELTISAGIIPTD
jgi:hypothetical protein